MSFSIDRVVLHPFSIPLKMPFRISAGEIREKNGLIVEVRSGDLTGWDLSLDGPVLRDSSGITVTFAEECALFAGPPEPQKEAEGLDYREYMWLLLNTLPMEEKAARAPRWVPIWAQRSSLQTAVTRFRTPLSWRLR